MRLSADERRRQRAERRVALWLEREPDPEKPEVHAAQLARVQAQLSLLDETEEVDVVSEQLSPAADRAARMKERKGE
jgi:hypothetical protein